MVLVVVVCTRLRLNPDNVATPVAASLGDITTLALLAGLSTLLHVWLSKLFLWSHPTEYTNAVLHGASGRYFPAETISLDTLRFRYLSSYVGFHNFVFNLEFVNLLGIIEIIAIDSP